MMVLLRRTPDIAGSSPPTAALANRHISQQTGQKNGRTSALVAPITLRSQTWSDEASGQSTTFDDVPMTSNNEITANIPSPDPVTKRESRFASLFIALLAVSPMAIEYDAADQQTMEAAQEASGSAPQPEAFKKTEAQPGSGVRSSEIRKTRWKRFKYELGLKMRITGRRKAKDRWKWTQADDVGLEVLRQEERYIYTDMERQNSS